MKKLMWLVALMVATLTVVPAAADSDFYVIAGGSAVGTKITSLPYTISKPGFYYLGGNLDYNGVASKAITVNANDVTIDLMGFSLNYYDPTQSNTAGGINIIDNRENVEIRNGTVRGFGDCIGGTGSKHRVINVRVTNSYYNGIILGGNNHLVKNCNVSNNDQAGIHVEHGIIADCVASNNNYGISLWGGNVIGCTAKNNTWHNFYLGVGVATAILADRNSAFGLNPNYYIFLGTTGVVITANNAGTP